MALRGFKDAKIIGVNRSHEPLHKAIHDGVIDLAYLLSDADYALLQSDMVVICLYPGHTMQFIKEHAFQCKYGCVLTDMAGIKAAVVKLQEFLPEYIDFVGGHPMAGREKSGYEAATPHLYRGCNYIITPTHSNRKESLILVKEMARYIGATYITETTPEKHDRIIAYTSQMAHVLAAAIINHSCLEESEGFDGGSFSDLTRVAELNEKMWSELFISNREPLSEVLLELEQKIALMRGLIQNGEQEEVREVLEQSTKRKQEWNRRRANGGAKSK